MCVYLCAYLYVCHVGWGDGVCVCVCVSAYLYVVCVCIPVCGVCGWVTVCVCLCGCLCAVAICTGASALTYQRVFAPLPGLSSQPSPFDRLPRHLALSQRTVDTPYARGAPLPPPYPPPPGPSSGPAPGEQLPPGPAEALGEALSLPAGGLSPAAVEVPPCTAEQSAADTQRVSNGSEVLNHQ